ncbi:DUF5711 family protein [Oscillospiraceae bacterium WX1]
MAHSKMRKKKKRRALRLAVSVFILAAVSLVAAVLIKTGSLSADGFRRLFSGGGTITSRFAFDASSGDAFADLGGSLAVCSNVGIAVYDKNGEKTFGETVALQCPAVASNGEVAVAYDQGGRILKFFTAAGVTKSLTTNGRIIAATVSESGYVALCTEEPGYKGLVTVYNAKGDEVYNLHSGQGYVLAAQVSPDHKSLAVLTLTDSGSRIIFLSLSSTDEKASCALPGEVALGIQYTDNNSVLLISSSALRLVRDNGKAEVLKDYTDKYLKTFDNGGDGFAVLMLSDYLVGSQGTLTTVDATGRTLGTLETTRKVLSVSAKDDSVAVLYDDGLVIYTKNLKERVRFDETTGSVKTIMRSGGTALLITTHSAAVCG